MEDQFKIGVWCRMKSKVCWLFISTFFNINWDICKEDVYKDTFWHEVHVCACMCVCMGIEVFKVRVSLLATMLSDENPVNSSASIFISSSVKKVQASTAVSSLSN